MQQTVQEVHANIEQQAEKNSNALRVVTKMEVGEAIRQGDVYVWRVESIPEEYNIPTMELQIAQGETKGSRHILEDSPTLRVFQKTTRGPLDGPAFKSDSPITLTHPEHAHFQLPAGCYISEYQQDYAAEEIRAVRD